ncbi:MAG: hypothetical protein ABI779_09430 [Acidobacteriota bacterium]
MRWTQIHIAVEGRGDLTGGDAKEWLSGNFPGLVKTSSAQPSVVVLAAGGKSYFRESEVVRMLDLRLGNRVSFTQDGTKKQREKLRNALAVRRTTTNPVDDLPYYEVELIYDRASTPQQDPAYQAIFSLSSGAGEAAPHAEMYSGDPILGDAEHYRLTIRDVFTVTDVSSDAVTLLGPTGDTISRPADYRTNGWMPRVRCAVPIQLRIQKKDSNDRNVPMKKGEVFVAWSVDDPPASFVAETMPIPAPRTITWLREFYRRTGPRVQGRIAGNKNCPKKFGGVREDDGGVKAPSVLGRLLPDGQVVALAALGDSEAKSSVAVAADGSGTSNILFCPPPIGGDSYRINVALVGKKGERMRVWHPVVRGRLSYSHHTGIITMWRSFPISFIFRLEMEDPIVWDAVADTYAAAYVEIEKNHASTTDFEISSYSIDRHIAAAFQDVFHDQYTGWRRGVLVPQSVSIALSLNVIQGRIDRLVKSVVSGVAAVSMGVGDPNDDAYDFRSGLYVVVCAKIAPDADLVGQYIGSGQFLSTEFNDITKTCKHEIGHAFYLRHGYTVPLYAMGELDMASKSDFPYDHDSADVMSCLMSYANDAVDTEGNALGTPVTAHFCSVCLLSLRFWDMVKVRGDAQFQTMIERDLLSRTAYLLDPPVLGDPSVPTADGGAGGTACGTIVVALITRPWTEDRNGLLAVYPTVECTVGLRVRFAALAAPDVTPANFGGVMWVDLSYYSGGRWILDDPSLGTLDQAFGTFDPTAPGTTRLSYTCRGYASNSVTIVIAP